MKLSEDREVFLDQVKIKRTYLDELIIKQRRIFNQYPEAEVVEEISFAEQKKIFQGLTTNQIKELSASKLVEMLWALFYEIDNNLVRDIKKLFSNTKSKETKFVKNLFYVFLLHNLNFRVRFLLLNHLRNNKNNLPQRILRPAEKYNLLSYNNNEGVLLAIAKDLGIDETLRLVGFLTGALRQSQFTNDLMTQLSKQLGIELKESYAAGTISTKTINSLLIKLNIAKQYKFVSEFDHLNELVLANLLSPLTEIETSRSQINFYLADVVFDLMGDIRKRWSILNFSPELKNLLRSWITGKDIKLFIDLVRKTSNQEEIASQQWAYREKFWSGLYELGLIKESRLILGTKGRKISKQSRIKEISYATLINQRAAIDCCLLLRVGNEVKDVVVSEWNANGACRVWSELEIDFNQDSFSSDDLIKNEDDKVAHASSNTYYWQSKLAEILQERLDIIGLERFYEL